jgi:flagellar FliL protein
MPVPEDRRSAPTPPPDNVPPPAVAPAPARSGLTPWLPLIITTVFMPVLAWGMAQFVILPQLEHGLNINVPANSQAAGKNKKDKSKEKSVSVPMNKLLVNVADTMGARYLLVSLAIVGSGSDFQSKITEHDAQLRDIASGVLGSKSLADLEKPGERNLIRNELLSGFNNILGDSTVQEIYLPEFAIQ